MMVHIDEEDAKKRLIELFYHSSSDAIPVLVCTHADTTSV